MEPERTRGFTPTIYLYDNYPGGIGQSEPLFSRVAALIDAAGNLIASCDCTCGCPACVGPVLAVDEAARRAAKELALSALGLFI